MPFTALLYSSDCHVCSILQAQHCCRVVVASSTGLNQHLLACCCGIWDCLLHKMHELNENAYVSLKCVVVSLTIMSLTCVSAGADTEVTTRSMHENYALVVVTEHPALSPLSSCILEKLFDKDAQAVGGIRIQSLCHAQTFRQYNTLSYYYCGYVCTTQLSSLHYSLLFFGGNCNACFKWASDCSCLRN